VLSAYAPDLKGGDDGGPHALSRSAIGFAGLVRLLQAEDVPVLISRDGPGRRDPNWGLLVLTPEETTKPSEIFDFTTAAGPALVVLPKWETTPDQLNSGWVRSAGLINPAANGNGYSSGSESFNVGSGPIYAHWFGSAQGIYDLGVIGVKITFQPAGIPVPLPASLVLLLSGLGVLFGWQRRPMQPAVANASTAAA